MSILNVEHLTHGFGDRAIFNDVSFRLLKGEKRPCRLSRPALHTDQRHDNRECVKIGVRMVV